MLTRPEKQAEKLINMIVNSGNVGLSFSVIAIEPKKLSKDEAELIKNLSNIDWVFFISANAVHQSMHLLGDYKLYLNKTCKVAVIGPATAEALSSYNIKADVISSTTFNSEGLLAEPILQNVADKRIIILRGVGGRELLASTLLERNALVYSVPTYIRKLPNNDFSNIENQLKRGLINAIVVMSNESLMNLCKLVNDKFIEYLYKVQLVVISQRTYKLANDLGFLRPAIVAKTPSDKDVFNCLC